jgi:hypothetical protein
LFFVWNLFSALSVAVLFLAIAPRFAQKVSDTIAERPWVSLGLGLVLVITVPFTCLLVLATVVGIPLSMIVGLLYGIALYVSPMFVGLLVGQLVLQRTTRETERPSPYLSVALGLFLLYLVLMLPFLGWFVYVLSMVTGLGALAWTAWQWRGSSSSSPSPIDLKAGI